MAPLLPLHVAIHTYGALLPASGAPYCRQHPGECCVLHCYCCGPASAPLSTAQHPQAGCRHIRCSGAGEERSVCSLVQLFVEGQAGQCSQVVQMPHQQATACWPHGALCYSQESCTWGTSAHMHEAANSSKRAGNSSEHRSWRQQQQQ